MKCILVVWSFLLAPLAFPAEQFIAEVGAEFWANPRTGEAIIKNKTISVAVKQLLMEPEAYLILRHPEGESGELWGLELQAWLVSLGLVSDRIELQPGYEGLDGVGLFVESPNAEADKVEPSLAIEVIETVVDGVPAIDEVVDEEAESHSAEDVVEQEEVELP